MTLDTNNAEYPGSVVWQRKSGFVIPFYTYQLVQILDGDGNKIQPAYEKFVNYMTTGEGADSDAPGYVYYHTDSA